MLVRAFALMLLFASRVFAADTMRLHFIDVGQGAATLIEFPCAAMLIDAGGEKNTGFDSTKELMTYLGEFFEGRPDLNDTLHSFVITHPHIDHTRGVKAVLAKYRILNALDNGMETGTGRYGQIALHDRVEASEEASADGGIIKYQPIFTKKIPKGQGKTNGVIDPISCGSTDPEITALWGRVESAPGWSKKAFGNANNHSVVLRIDFGKSSFLVSGDMQLEGIGSLLAHYKDTPLLKTDVIQVNHHGAENGTSLPLLAAAQPRIAVIAMGSKLRHEEHTAWDYGHPRNLTYDKLIGSVSRSRPATEVDIGTGVCAFQTVTLTKAVYGTGWDGTVVLEADAQGNWRVDDRAPTPGVVNLNTATVEELITLPMIGHKRANAIVKYRDQNGPF